jgi:autoinducer 2-degrading protein
MHIVLGTIKVKEEHLESFLENVRVHAAASAREPGCVRYEVLQDAADPTTVCLFEVFRSEADLEVHHGQDHYRRWMSMSRDWRDRSQYARRVLRNVFPADADSGVRT